MSKYPEQKKKCSLTGIFILSILTAGFYGLASPGLYWFPFLWILLVPFLEAIHGQNARRGFFTGWLCGMMIHLILYSWAVGTIQRFTGFGLSLSILFWFLLALYSGLAFGLMGSLHGFLARSIPVPGIVIFALAYTTMEYLFPFLFPWHLYAGLYGMIPLLQISDIFGIYGLTVLVVFVNYSVWEVFRFIRKRRAFPYLSVGLSAGFILLSLLYGYRRMAQIEDYQARAEQLTIGIVQPDIRIEDRRTAPSHSEMWPRYEKLSGKAVKQGADIIIWPESAVYFPFDPGADDLSPSGTLRRLVRSLKVPHVFGAASIRPDGIRNTAFLLDAKGAPAGNL